MTPLRLIACAAMWMFACASVGVAKEPIAAELDGLKNKQVIPLFQSSNSEKAREQLFKRIIDDLPGGVWNIRPILEKRIAALEGAYFKQLKMHLPAAYRKHLAGLTDEEIYKIQFERRKWRSYIETTSARHDFTAQYFSTALQAAGLTMPYLNEVLPAEAAEIRAEFLEFVGYLVACLKEFEADDADPTKGKKSPTGHSYPKLDRPRTGKENLEYLEKSMVLALTVAPEGATPTLLTNARVAKEIDYEEGEFVLIANIIRLFVGSIVWSVDPLTCACARDHSNDRKNGLASGHSSTVPGKHGMGDRARYWGTNARSEGAGGGTGMSYLRGLSYGGGHTGPLYSRSRNVVGIGIRKGAATSMYRTDKRIIHPCAVSEKEGFMPPGLTRKDVHSAALRSMYRALQNEEFGEAHKVAEDAKIDDTVEKMVLRFFKAAIQAELDWQVKAISAISGTGDVYYAQEVLNKSLESFEGLSEQTSKLAAAYDPPEGLGGAHDNIAVGKKFYRLVDDSRSGGMS